MLVNGTFTEKINISRSVRQGCQLSMLLFVLSLEPLIQSIQNNPKIDGLKSPYHKHEIKVLTHADDMTAVVRNGRSYCELRKKRKPLEFYRDRKLMEKKRKYM